MNRYVSVAVGVSALISSAGFLWYGVADASTSLDWGEREHLASQTYDSNHVVSQGLQPVRSHEEVAVVSILLESAAFGQLPADLRAAVRSEAAANFRPLLIEGEQRGVTFTVPLSSTISTSGPWTKVDKDALRAKLTQVEPADSSADLRSHDAYDELVSRGSLTALDYRVATYTSVESFDEIEVAVDLVSGTVLRLGPRIEPKALGATVRGRVPVPMDHVWGKRRAPAPRFDDATGTNLVEELEAGQ